MLVCNGRNYWSAYRCHDVQLNVSLVFVLTIPILWLFDNLGFSFVGREKLADTGLYIRNFGENRSRITLIEPVKLADYDPIRVQGCAVILFNPGVGEQLKMFYQGFNTRARRNAVFPGGISSTADVAIKRHLGLNK